MGTVTTQLASQARTIFSDLGYTVTDDGHGIRAERKWRVVHVTPMPEVTDAPTAGGLHCFVTWAKHTDKLKQHLLSQNLDYDWALISVRDDGEYDVCDATTLE